MSRKRKSIDVLAQLGEPLPLPYRPTPPQTLQPEDIKEETSEGEVVAADTFRPRHVLLRHYQDRETRENRPRLPIWQHQRVPSQEIQQQQTVLDSIESKIASLKADLESGASIDADRLELEQIDLRLEHIIEQRLENNLMQELKRLQHQSGGPNLAAAEPTKHRSIVVVILAVLIPLLAVVGSYVAGGYSYEYCYYFC